MITTKTWLTARYLKTTPVMWVTKKKFHLNQIIYINRTSLAIKNQVHGLRICADQYKYGIQL